MILGFVPADRSRHPDGRGVRGPHEPGDARSATASGRAARSPSSRRSTSGTASSRWAMTAQPTSPSAPRPLLRGLGVYHGKRGWGVSVEFDVTHGPVTTLGVGQERDGTLTFIASEGEVVRRPAARDRQHDLAGSTSAATPALDRRLERLGGRPSLGARRRSPIGRLPRCRGSARRPVRRSQGLAADEPRGEVTNDDRMPAAGTSRYRSRRPPRLERVPLVQPKVALVAGGLGAYWPQFPELLADPEGLGRPHQRAPDRTRCRRLRRRLRLGRDRGLRDRRSGSARPTATSRSCSYRRT